MNTPMNPANYLIAMLHTYCEWLNIWQQAEPVMHDAHHYEPRQFVTTDPEQSLYGGSTLHALVPMGGSAATDRLVVCATVTDGDDGGPTELIAWFDIDTDNGTNPLHSMVQGFDTNLQFIFNDYQFVNTPSHPSD
jgi:hypothetical protein